MNVLVLQSELGVLRGGGENFTRNLFEAFAARGHRVAAAFTAGPAGGYPLPLPAAFEPIPVAGWWASNPGQSALAWLSRRFGAECCRAQLERIQEALSWRTYRWHCLRFQRAVEGLLARRCVEFDAIYVHGNPLLASRAAAVRPTVLRLPGPVGENVEPLLRRVHAVCANGDALARLRSLVGNHATELPIGIDLRTFHPGPSSVRARLGWGEQDCVVGYVGRLIQLKGADLLAAGFRRAAAEHPELKLLIVGSGNLEGHVSSVLAREIAARRVHIEPGIDHEKLPEWYRAMDLIVMPSRYENHSNALLEAMACGVPFAASDVGGNRALAATGAGWLFAPASENALADCVARATAARANLQARGEAACRALAGHRGWSASAERLEQILCSCLEPAR